ncbi:hypothetical protein [Marinifilum flexuosum]|uniref:hypothetical protein n=1 Tax=Marinifilum flexuosum TaxID=1117708 RepID=UPI0024943E9D|nr:hypothetical protein [Marinifilum flexuosum]
MIGNSKLFSFIFLTIKSSANDPKAKNFLPTLLSNIKRGGSPLLPLTEDEWAIGKLAGQSGLSISKSIANQYFQINGTPVIPYPADPEPSLDLKDDKGIKKVIIKGLDNAYITGFENYAYDVATNTVTADIKIQFNYWTKKTEKLQPGQKITPLSLDTPFILTQKLCKSQSILSTTCSDPSASPVVIVGNGTFTADITQMNFEASIKINVEENRSGLNVQVTKLGLVTTGAMAPQFSNVKAKLSNISDYQSIISTLITSFMSAPDASEAVFTQMQASLNSDHNIDALSSTLKTQVASLLDNRLGKVAGSLPSDQGQQDSNLVDLYLFDRIRYSLNNPSSSWYVQTLLKSYKNPSLNPFKPQNLNIGSFEIFAGFNLTNVTLSNIVITGFPNATSPAETMLLIPPQLSIAILLGALGSTTATADFSADYTGGTLKFGMTITVNSVSLTSLVTPSGEQASELVVTFDSMEYIIPKVSDMKITISDHSGFGPAVEKMLNTTDIQNKIVSAVNSEFKGHLADISKEVTSIASQLINQQLSDSYS